MPAWGNARHVDRQQSRGSCESSAGSGLREDRQSGLRDGVKTWDGTSTSHRFALSLFFWWNTLEKLHLVLLCQGKSLSSTGNHFEKLGLV